MRAELWIMMVLFIYLFKKEFTFPSHFRSIALMVLAFLYLLFSLNDDSPDQ